MEKKTVILNHFKNRKRKKSIKDETKELVKLSQVLLNQRLKQAKLKKNQTRFSKV